MITRRGTFTTMRGQAITEFALMLPLLLMIVMGSMYLVRLELSKAKSYSVAHAKARALALPGARNYTNEEMEGALGLRKDSVASSVPPAKPVNPGQLRRALSRLADDEEAISSFMRTDLVPKLRVTISEPVPPYATFIFGSRPLQLTAEVPIAERGWGSSDVREGLLGAMGNAITNSGSSWALQDPRFLMQDAAQTFEEEINNRNQNAYEDEKDPEKPKPEGNSGNGGDDDNDDDDEEEDDD